MDHLDVFDIGRRVNLHAVDMTKWFTAQSNPIETANIQCVGGKGKNLFTLQRMGFHVPPFVVLSPQMDSPENLSDADIEWLQTELPNTEFLAVRSSAMEEDGGEYSFAGQFKSVLFVPFHKLNQAIQEVWQSLSSAHIETYCKQHNLPPPTRMAIVIQQMIPAETAGVCFGMNPINGKRNETLISAVFGLGEGLVSGNLNADTFTVSPAWGPEPAIASTISKKTTGIFWNPQGDGICERPIEEHKQDQPTLSTVQILAITAASEKLKTALLKPQDIEFAYLDGALYLLQTRPITGLHRMADPSGEKIIWDNSNIIESYPGVTTPLTFGFILQMYESVYIQLCRLLGVSEKDLIDNHHLFANMLGLIQGRVYYNLLSWYKALALLPGYSLNAEFMEKMMGVKERFELKNLPQRTRFQEKLRVLNMVKSMISNLRALPKMRRDFQSEFELVMQAYNRNDLSLHSAEELMVLYQNFEQTLLKKWKAPLVNDFFAMIYFGVTQKLAVKYQLPEGIHNDLLCGARDIISTEPIERMQKISTMILANPQAKHDFETLPAEQIWSELNQYPEIHASITAYIQKFGDRCVGELKLETITYRQNPFMLIQGIQSYVRQGIVYKHSAGGIDIDMRDAAEKIVSQTLSNKPLKRWIFNYFLKQTRILVSARENLRFERTRGFGKVREIFIALGNKLYTEGIIQNPRDIFYLKHHEIFDFIKGTAVTPSLSTLIELRKKEFRGFETTPTSERIVTFGMVYHGNSFQQAESMTDSFQGDLQGLGCCPGRVRAKVQVVHHPSEVEDLQGDILVTASTDPGWVTLFPTASAILVERGSLLSHSAIVSRELGKPCIVGITGLLHRLKTGDWVEMDGSTGQVKLIEPTPIEKP